MKRAGQLLVIGFVLLGTASAAERRKFEGYAEWWRGGDLIVDGQRVRPGSGLQFKGKGAARDFASIPLGYEVKVEADRQADGSWLARKIEAKPNGLAMFESDLRTGFDELESRFRRYGSVFEEDDQGHRHVYGRLRTDGPDVWRVHEIVDDLLPPYVDDDSLRVYVVENDDWNAMAAPNGSLYVYTGLLENTDDDELALILGHELAHVTHEHSRREAKKGLWSILFIAGAAALAEEIEDKTARTLTQAAVFLGSIAWQNSYGRACEDQADRVGLRYAYEAGYDVNRAPHLWQRFARKYGDLPKAVHFFVGDHSRSKDRSTKLARELALNYAVAAASR